MRQGDVPDLTLFMHSLNSEQLYPVHSRSFDCIMSVDELLAQSHFFRPKIANLSFGLLFRAGFRQARTLCVGSTLLLECFSAVV